MFAANLAKIININAKNMPRKKRIPRAPCPMRLLPLRRPGFRQIQPQNNKKQNARHPLSELHCPSHTSTAHKTSSKQPTHGKHSNVKRKDRKPDFP